MCCSLFKCHTQENLICSFCTLDVVFLCLVRKSGVKFITYYWVSVFLSWWSTFSSLWWILLEWLFTFGRYQHLHFFTSYQTNLLHSRDHRFKRKQSLCEASDKTVCICKLAFWRMIQDQTWSSCLPWIWLWNSFINQEV